MKKNMASIDRGIRLLFVAIIVMLFILGELSGIAAIILGIFGIVFLFTGATGHCPAYTVLKTSTLKEKK